MVRGAEKLCIALPGIHIAALTSVQKQTLSFLFFLLLSIYLYLSTHSLFRYGSLLSLSLSLSSRHTLHPSISLSYRSVASLLFGFQTHMAFQSEQGHL